MAQTEPPPSFDDFDADRQGSAGEEAGSANERPRPASARVRRRLQAGVEVVAGVGVRDLIGWGLDGGWARCRCF